MQSGLTVKWQRDSKFYFNLEHRLKSHDRYRDSKVKINLQHLEMAFWSLAIGCVMSAGVFLMEIFDLTRKIEIQIFRRMPC